MADEETAIAPAALETPASPEQQQIDEPQAIPDYEPELSADGEEQTAAVADEDEDDLDFGFQKYRVPKKLKEAVEQLRADSTRKTQDAAARQKALDERELQQAEASEAEMEYRSDLRKLGKTLEARAADLEMYESYTDQDWQAFSDQDPKGAQDHWRNFQLLRSLEGQKAALEAKIGNAEKERTAKAQQDIAKRWQETGAYAAKEIPGWSKDTADKVFAYAETKGVPKDFLERNMSPILVGVLHDAMIGRQTLNAPTVKAPAVPAQPLRVVAARSSPNASRSLAELAKDNKMDEFADSLNAKLAKRAGR